MANWLSLSKLQEWEDLCFLGYQYDSILDSEIYLALEDTETINKINPNIDWEDDTYLAEHLGIPESSKHAYRVASIVNDIKTNKMHESINLDTYNIASCCSSIGNGHHRIRSLQYMGLDYGPFSLSGSVEALENLVLLAGTECKPEHTVYFDKKLIDFDPLNDILVLDPNYATAGLTV